MDLELFTLSLNTQEKRKLLGILKGQLLIVDAQNRDKLSIEKFVEERTGLSKKLKNLLLDYAHNYDRGGVAKPFPFVEDINKYDFLELNTAGRKTWDELHTFLKEIPILQSGFVWDRVMGKFEQNEQMEITR